MTLALLHIMNPPALIGNRTLDYGPQALPPSDGFQPSDSTFAAVMGEEGARDGRRGSVVDGDLNEDAKRRGREDLSLCNQQGVIAATPEVLRGVAFNEVRRALASDDEQISGELPPADTSARNDGAFDKRYQLLNLPAQDSHMTNDCSYEELPHDNMIGAASNNLGMKSPAQRSWNSDVNFIDTFAVGRDSNWKDTLDQRISGERFASTRSVLLKVGVAEDLISGTATAGLPVSESDVSAIHTMNLNHSIDREVGSPHLAPVLNQNADRQEALLGNSINASSTHLEDKNDNTQIVSSRKFLYDRHNPESVSPGRGADPIAEFKSVKEWGDAAR